MYLYFIVFVFGWIDYVLCQECVSPCNLNLSTCTFVDYPVYTIGLNLTENEIQAAGIINTVRAYSSLVNQECRDAVYKFTCGVLYPGCKGYDHDDAIAQKPCIQMCTKVQEVCAPYISLLTPEQQAFIDCNRKDPDGSPKYSNSNCYTLDNLIPRLGCNNSNTTGPDEPRSGCQRYDPSLTPNSRVACAPFVSSEIFVPNVFDPSVQTVMDNLASVTGIPLIDKVRMVMPFGCYKHLLSLLCQTAFPTCHRTHDSNNASRIIEAGVVPCYESCIDTYERCEPFFAMANAISALRLNCSMTNAITGLPLWSTGPTYDKYLTDQNATISMNCSASLFPPNATSPFVLREVDQCPKFLAETSRRTDADRQCWMPCPDPSYSKEMWDDVVVICLITASVSITLMIFMLVSYALIKEYRQRQMHMCEFLSAGLSSLAFLIGGRNPQENVWCTDATTYSSTKNNPACEMQGFLFQFGCLSVATWWLVIAFHMFRRVVLASRTKLPQAMRYYHIFAWGIPFVFTVTTSGLQAHAFGPPVPFCSIQSASFHVGAHMYESRVPLDIAVFDIL